MAKDQTPNAAILVIGDEILSGRTRDSNLHFLAGELTRHGIPVAEARIVADDHDRIVAAVRELAARHTHVFTSGGIGPTHDDITADAVADAFGRRIDVRADARALLEAHYATRGTELNAARLRMARIPDGATLIDNPVSAAPGFTLENVHVMAGVPEVFQAMVAALLPGLRGGAPVLSQTLTLLRGEGDIAAPLSELVRDFPELSIGSYPQFRNGAFQVSIVVRGTEGARIDAAMTRLAARFAEDIA
ncbi:MAG: competence/damage-inducible protein A [Rhodobacteraceae bacterium]|nr:competence/damage-inducible protein A [Paracoccaceae bacterium]